MRVLYYWIMIHIPSVSFVLHTNLIKKIASLWCFLMLFIKLRCRIVALKIFNPINNRLILRLFWDKIRNVYIHPLERRRRLHLMGKRKIPPDTDTDQLHSKVGTGYLILSTSIMSTFSLCWASFVSVLLQRPIESNLCTNCDTKSEMIRNFEQKLLDSEDSVDKLLMRGKTLEIELETSRKQLNITIIERNALSEALCSSVNEKKTKKGWWSINFDKCHSKYVYNMIVNVYIVPESGKVNNEGGCSQYGNGESDNEEQCCLKKLSESLPMTTQGWVFNMY